MDGPKRIQSIQRAISVVEHLATRGASSLSQLRKATGLSNSTLLRIIATLSDHGWVRRHLSEGRYELPFSLGQTLVTEALGHPLAELSSQYLIKLQKKIHWPSDIATSIHPGKIQILESTRLKGLFAPTGAYSVQPSMVKSAHGRAYLAYCSKEEREMHFDAILKMGDKEEKLFIESGKIEEILSETQSQGYGVRERQYWVEPLDFGPDVAAIAVPILSDDCIYGTINAVWLREVMEENSIIEAVKPEIQNMANLIAIEAKKKGISGRVFMEK